MKSDIKDNEILTVNKDIIKVEQHNGFKVNENKFLMHVKKLPQNIYKLSVALLIAVSELVPDIMKKVPVVGYATDLIATFGTTYASNKAYDKIFDDIICPIMKIQFKSPEYFNAYWDFTHTEGKYYMVSQVIKTIATFAMKHPGLVLAGGAVVAGLAVKIVAGIGKKISERIKFNKLDEKGKDIYLLLKDILKKSRKIKHTENGKVLLKDLSITFDIVNQLKDYPEVKDKIKAVLLKIQDALNKKSDNYNQYRLELETIVFKFDRKHDSYLNKQIGLLEESGKVKA